MGSLTTTTNKSGHLLVLATSTAAASTVTALCLCYLSSLATTSYDATQSSRQSLLSRVQSAKDYILSHAKNLIVSLSGVEQRIVILHPSKDDKNPPREHPSAAKNLTLLQIFPGIFLEAKEYFAIGKVLQSLADKEDVPLVIAIGISLKSCHPFVQWALTPQDLSKMMQQKAAKEVLLHSRQQQTEKTIQASESSVFANTFLWGHSWGGFEAMRAALPSSTSGLILYGCSLSLYQSPLQARPWPDLFQNNLLSSYPRPVLTMMGERDGFLRWHTLAGEAHTLHKDSQRRIKSSSSTGTSSRAQEVAAQKALQATDELRKPVVILPDLNHMHMAMGSVPERTAKSGRSELVGPAASLSEAHETLARLVLDFVHTHSSPVDSNSKVQSEAKKRLLQRHSATESLFLGPFSRLSDRVFVSQFIHETQRKLLHVTSNTEEAFHFYDESDGNEDEDRSGLVEKEPFTIVTHWHQETNDFIYSKPRWSLDRNCLWLEAHEQAPISLPGGARSATQISNTLAFKGKTQMAILHNNTKFQAVPDSPAPTLMQLNQRTFDHVLNHVVTRQQRQCYKKYGTELRFGPDVLVWPPPKWVETPLLLSRYPPAPDKRSKDPKTTTTTEESYYLLQSPYVTTAHMDRDLPPPYAGAWYGKPMSPAQAFEWIVFDCFKA